MLTLFTDGVSHNCERVGSREFLRIGTLGIGGLSLSHWLGTKAEASSSVLRDRAVVVLNLQGGPTHIETFDPKMSARAEYRAMFGEVATSLAGVSFGSHFPRLAAMADRLAIVRSYRHGIGSHATAAMHVMAGGNPTGANMGSIYARVAGANSPRTGIPNAALVMPRACGESYKSLSSNPSRIADLGNLPSHYRPFDPSAGGQVIENMKMRIAEDRLDDRRSLLSQFDNLKRTAERSGVVEGASRYQQQAFDVIVGGVSDAFDWRQEDPQTIARYDTAEFKIPKKLQRKKKNVPGQSPIALGKQMLLARRLVEADCRFVTVTSAGWDMHGNAFGINDGMPLLGPAVDRAVSAFLEDLESRGLSDRVLLVITGEFGRTPKINNKGGRDHWGNLCTLAFAGGGLPMGLVVGQSDRRAGAPASDPVSSSQVLGTIMHTLVDPAQLRLASGVPDDLLRALTSVQPIPQLVV